MSLCFLELSGKYTPHYKVLLITIAVLWLFETISISIAKERSSCRLFDPEKRAAYQSMVENLYPSVGEERGNCFIVPDGGLDPNQAFVKVSQNWKAMCEDRSDGLKGASEASSVKSSS